LSTDHSEFASSQDTANQYNEIEANTDVSDGRGHGTHVAATAMGKKDGSAMHGVAYDSDVLAIRVLDDDGSGSVTDVAAGIDRAVAASAKVINLSLGSAGRSGLVYDAQSDAATADVLIVAATGNDTAESPSYPAADVADFTGQIAVGSVDSDNEISSFSNECGTTAASKCLVAPGEDIYAAMSIGSTIDSAVCDGSGYCSISGTSMATPHVAGAAAVVMAAWPTLTADEVATILLESATYLEGGTEIVAGEYNDRYGHGLLNLLAAVQASGSSSLASGTEVTSAGYDIETTSFVSDPIFGLVVSLGIPSCVSLQRRPKLIILSNWNWSILVRK